MPIGTATTIAARTDTAVSCRCSRKRVRDALVALPVVAVAEEVGQVAEEQPAPSPHLLPRHRHGGGAASRCAAARHGVADGAADGSRRGEPSTPMSRRSATNASASDRTTPTVSGVRKSRLKPSMHEGAEAALADERGHGDEPDRGDDRDADARPRSPAGRAAAPPAELTTARVAHPLRRLPHLGRHALEAGHDVPHEDQQRVERQRHHRGPDREEADHRHASREQRERRDRVEDAGDREHRAVDAAGAQAQQAEGDRDQRGRSPSRTG